ncbi:MAG: hypothetical protein WAV07_19870 [Candidatus Contendobacter sp.]
MKKYYKKQLVNFGMEHAYSLVTDSSSDLGVRTVFGDAVDQYDRRRLVAELFCHALRGE